VVAPPQPPSQHDAIAIGAAEFKEVINILTPALPAETLDELRLHHLLGDIPDLSKKLSVMAEALEIGSVTPAIIRTAVARSQGVLRTHSQVSTYFSFIGISPMRRSG